ncbi:transposase [Sinorhizobium fredii]|uniref:IS5 family insertion sequence transposase domain-containing protein n=1 Tax=Rhizobium fredii TaxID=380 RepID=A0A2L0HBQ8_RHIFR|nr:transposase [Sinorhizobium fredii]AUX78930.1 IS5 family insertion sequence transposase domain-containing protein [Sinorhizobium fredii]
MRSGDVRTGKLFSYVDLEDRVRRDHPLRAIRQIMNDALVLVEREFAALYSPIGRPSIAPEKLLRAMLLQAFYWIRSERLLMERLGYDLLFRWFVGIGINGRRSAIYGRTTRHSGYGVSLRIRKRIEEAFGWIKTVAGQDKTKFRGLDRVGWAFTFAAAAYDLVRLPKLMAVSS